MSTHFIVPDIAVLHTVTDPSPGIGVDTANGPSYVEAIGTALIWLYHGGTVGWICYELPHVLVMPNCDAVLYSTRTMRNLFGFRHDFDSSNPAISCPGRPRRFPLLTMDLDFAYPSPLCAPADRIRMGSSAVWLPSPAVVDRGGPMTPASQ